MANILIKLVGSGIGLAAEAREARKAPKVTTQGSTSRELEQSATIDELEDQNIVRVSEKQADGLISKGQAISVNQKKLDHGPDDPPPKYTSDEENDEADWELDDAAQEQTAATTLRAIDEHNLEFSSVGEKERQHYVDKIVVSFIGQHPSPSYSQKPNKLPCSVIVPQRRPRDKTRGFIRAYAPVLSECGIDQTTFLQFLETMDKASKASPVIDVVLIGAMIAGFVPSVAAMITSAVVIVAARMAQILQSNKRNHSFLVQMNEKFFKPRGLICLVMKYAPGERSSHESVDLSQTLLASLNPSTSTIKRQLNNFSSSSGKTYGELEMPEAAPLVFPNLDAVAAANQADGKKKSSLKAKGAFIATYMDRRAQASYLSENPDSILASANPIKPRFASRYGDPSHAVYSGSLVSFVTGGRINASTRDGRKGGLGRGPLGLIGEGLSLVDAARGKESGSSGQEEPGNDSRNQIAARTTNQPLNRAGGPLGLVKRKLKKDVLYLLITNMPTDEEIQAARSSLGNNWRGSVASTLYVRNRGLEFVTSIRHDGKSILGEKWHACYNAKYDQYNRAMQHRQIRSFYYSYRTYLLSTASMQNPPGSLEQVNSYMTDEE